jgi:hypothetical protein
MPLKATYKDRLLMEQLPHLLVEGMLISAFALKAYRGYIFPDIAPCPGVHEQLEVKTGTEDIFPQQARFGSFGSVMPMKWNRVPIKTVC